MNGHAENPGTAPVVPTLSDRLSAVLWPGETTPDQLDFAPMDAGEILLTVFQGWYSRSAQDEAEREGDRQVWTHFLER